MTTARKLFLKVALTAAKNYAGHSMY